MGGDELWSLAEAVLRGERGAPRLAPQRIGLAQYLPRVAEHLRCTQGAAIDLASRSLSELWTSLESDELSKPEFGTPQLGAGCLEAASLLGHELPARLSPSRAPWLPARPVELSSHRAQLSTPLVLAPLVNDMPARVFHTARHGVPAHDDDATRDTAALVKSFLGIDMTRWALERPAPGRSKMAALFLRALFEQWPEAMVRLAPDGYNPSRDTLPAVAITGELSADGLARPVAGLDDKVRRFFTQYPEGSLFVPASQFEEARAIFNQLSHPESDGSHYGRLKRQQKVQLFRGVLDLIIRFGVRTPACAESQLFDKLRESCQHVVCWNGPVRDVSKTIALGLVRRTLGRSGAGQWKALSEEELLEETYEEFLAGRSRPAFIEGGPGSGKSIISLRLAYHLLQGKRLFGPALRVDARRLVRAGLSIGRALHESLEHRLDEGACMRLVEVARSPALAGGVWLIIDGLDEVPADSRFRIHELSAGWPGPLIIGARPLPAEALGAPHVRLAALERHQQQQLFELEGRPGHWRGLQGGGEEWQPPHQGDRRKELVADLCTTPLGVSLLAMMSQEELGERLDVSEVLRRSISILLQRAEDTGRISQGDRMLVLAEGLGVLGAAAWSMIKRGAAELSLGDLARMRAEAEVRKAVYQVLNNSDLVQRAGPDLYQFSHKSLAEFCAALHLAQSSEAEVEPALPAYLGEPGTDAVVLHFGALVPAERLTRLLSRLVDDTEHPMTALAIATRLLVANGPERVELVVALKVLKRRLRFASCLGGSLSVPGGLGDSGELWLALERWAPTLRPYAQELIEACQPEVGLFLRGELPPMRRGYRPEFFYTVEGTAYTAADFAERLATALQLTLPPAVLIRFREGTSLLLSRPSGPWAIELESCFELAADEGRTDAGPAAASVWSQRAPASRQLERLDVLSSCIPAAVAPVLETVRQHGSVAQKREALLRAAINYLELGHYDSEGDWIPRTEFAQKLKDVDSRLLLEQWELLWACGLIGASPPHSEALEPLYAEFAHDTCGPARWRALVALARREEPVDTALLRVRLCDDFQAVRIQALVQSAAQGERPHVADACMSLSSLDDHERWVAWDATGLVWTAHLELLTSVLERRQPSRAQLGGVDLRDYDGWLPARAPWEQAVSRHGETARQSLIRQLHERLRSRGEYRRLFGLLEGPQCVVVEEFFDTWILETSLLQELLMMGTARQRQLAASTLERKREAGVLEA